MKDFLGNRTDESVNEFLSALDKVKDFGPKPLLGVSFNLNQISDVLECSDEIAKDLFSKPSIFKFDEQDQVYIEFINNDTRELEVFYLNSNLKEPELQISCERISRSLPDVPYDLECGGYSSRQSEAASLYKVAIINKLQENQYGKEIERILKQYDFSRWTGSDGKYVFTELLQKIQEEADSITRVVLNCANSKLLSDRIKKDTSYKGILKEEDGEKLRFLAEEDARINFIFNKKYEVAQNMREKMLIGEQLAEARSKLFESNNLSPELTVLWSIYKLNQNAIPGRAKRKIRNAAEIYVSELISSGDITNQESAFDFKKKLITRAQKLFLSRMKQIRYILWRDRSPDFDLSILLPKY